jgi:hypothetical protein
VERPVRLRRAQVRCRVSGGGVRARGAVRARRRSARRESVSEACALRAWQLPLRHARTRLLALERAEPGAAAARAERQRLLCAAVGCARDQNAQRDPVTAAAPDTRCRALRMRMCSARTALLALGRLWLRVRRHGASVAESGVSRSDSCAELV